MNRQFSTVGLFDPRIIKFLSVGVLNTVFGYALYVILIFVNVPYLTALFVATVAGVIFNYFSLGRMVFDGLGGWFVFGKFVLAYGIVYAVNAALLRSLTIKIFFLAPTWDCYMYPAKRSSKLVINELPGLQKGLM